MFLLDSNLIITLNFFTIYKNDNMLKQTFKIGLEEGKIKSGKDALFRAIITVFVFSFSFFLLNTSIIVKIGVFLLLMFLVGIFYTSKQRKNISEVFNQPNIKSIIDSPQLVSNNLISLAQRSSFELYEKLSVQPDNDFLNIRQEFLFLFCHILNRQIFANYSEEVGESIRLQFKKVLSESLIRFDNNFKEDEFWFGCNEREIKYGNCKELLSKDKLFTSDSSILPIFAREIAKILSSNLNPEIMMCSIEVCNNSIQEI